MTGFVWFIAALIQKIPALDALLGVAVFLGLFLCGWQ